MLGGVRWTPIFAVLAILICKKLGGGVIGFSLSVVPVRVGVRENFISIKALKGSNGASEVVTVSRTGLSPDGRMITDPWRRDVLFSVDVERILHESQSAHQHIQIIQTRSMGRVLVLDGAFQCAEADEASYHEMITHVPIMRKGAKTHGGAALVIGGGDGGVARELLRHKGVTSVDLVDIDSEVMRLSEEFLPTVWRHPTKPGEPLDSDSRLQIFNRNGFEFVSEGKPCSYDIIVVDASDPLGPGAALYSNDFYNYLEELSPYRKVTIKQFLFTTRAYGESFWYLPVSFRTVYHGLKAAFPVVKTYQCFTAIYPGGLWNLQVATLGDDPSKVDFNRAEALKGLSFYTPDVHEASFALPPVAEDLLKLPAPNVVDASKEALDKRRGDMSHLPLDFDVVQSVKDFVFDLCEAMRRSHRIDELEVLYSNDFPKLSSEYFKIEPWPVAEAMAGQCGRKGDPLFLLFYSELRLRHIRASLQPTIHDRFASWANYCDLLDAVLSCEDLDLIITPDWAFDIVNEFVEQFQAFCQFRTATDQLSQEERQALAENQDVWAIQNVISYLHGLIRISNIIPNLRAKREGVEGATPVPPYPSQLHENLGYFAIIAMSRLQCLLADYNESLALLDPIYVADSRNELFGQCLSAYSSLFMDMSISFIMLRRYRNAARALNEILLHLSRLSKSGQILPDLVVKRQEKMMALLAMVNILCPGDAGLDDQLLQTVQTEHKDKIEMMKKGSIAAFRDVFQWACPKFTVARLPDYNNLAAGSNSNLNALFKQQINLFVEDVKQQMVYPQLRSYLMSYTSIGIDKIAQLNELSRDDFICAVVAMKRKSTQKEWGWGLSEGGPVSGTRTLALKFNFFLEGEMVIVDEQAHEQRFEEWFLEQIGKCETLAHTAEKLELRGNGTKER